jgi:O-6-methylguanine DNA methyltransferase
MALMQAQLNSNGPIIVVERESPIGALTIAMQDHALRALRMGTDDLASGPLLGRNAAPVQLAGIAELDEEDAVIVRTIDAYFEGDVAGIDRLPVRPIGTGFAQRVWDALRAIPVGETYSYARLAGVVGVPNASRAVGRANATNPVAIVVPCHRVIRADGNLGGYGGGLDRKRWLLDHERRHAPAATGVLTL